MERRIRIIIPNFPLLQALLLSLVLLQVNSTTSPTTINTNEKISIIIGGGGAPSPSDPPEYPEQPCPPPPPPPPVECPPPPKPHNPPPSPPPPSPPPRHPPPPPPSPPPPHPPPPPIQYVPSAILQRALIVIQRFKRTIGYDPLNITRTWTGNRICVDSSVYRGFICDRTINDNETRIALVNFNGFNFDGRPSAPLALTNFLDGLPDIIAFHGNSNNFTGQVPIGPNIIPSLFELDLSNNEIRGGFPREILTSTNLTFVDVRFNRLTGEIPPGAFTLDLDVLFLNNNQFVGKIPDTIGKTPVLYLTLANNLLTGPIPKSIGQTSNTLREALLLNNQLSGCLPLEIGKLRRATLFDVSRNRLTGPIPLSFGCLGNIQYLNLSYNTFYGEVPESVCSLRNLYRLTLASNYFTQVGPECRRLISTGVLDVRMNCILDLPNQRSKKECTEFFLKKQTCSDINAMMSNIPCKIGRRHHSRRKYPVNRKLMDTPRTYAALLRP